MCSGILSLLLHSSGASYYPGNRFQESCGEVGNAKWTLHSTSRFGHSFSHWLMSYVVRLTKQRQACAFWLERWVQTALFTRFVFYSNSVFAHAPTPKPFGVRQHSEHSLCTGASGFISAVTGWPRWPSTGASRLKRMDTSDPGALTSP